MKIGISATLAVLALTGCGTTAGAGVASTPDAPPVVVHAKTFGDEFDANKVAAERKYKGRRITLTAKVTNISDSSVTLGEVTTDEFSMTQVSCDLAKTEQALQVKNGGTATVTGTVTGQTLGVIGFDDCVVSTR